MLVQWQHKQITCHRRWRHNLSLGLFEKAILLIIKVELPHQERLKTITIIFD